MKYPILLPRSLYTSLIGLLLTSLTIGGHAQTVPASILQKIEKGKQLYGQEALPMLDQAKSWCYNNACPDSIMGQIYHQLGVAYFQGYIDDKLAIAFADSAAYFYRQVYPENHPVLANEMYNKGIMQQSIGALSGAATDIRQALSIVQENPHLSAATSDSISAYWHQEFVKTLRLQRDFQQADTYAAQGLKVAYRRWSEPHETQGDLLRSLGNIRYDRSDFKQATLYYEQALTIFKQLGDRYEREQILTAQNIGKAYYNIGENDLAQRYLQQVDDYLTLIGGEAPNKRLQESQANIHINLLKIATARGNFAEANQHFYSANSLLNTVFATPTYSAYAELYYSIGEMMYQQGQLEQALMYCDQSIDILLPTDKTATSPIVNGPLKYLLKVFHLKAKVLTAKGSTVEALNVYEAFHQLISAYRQRQLSGWSKYYLIADVIPVYEAAIELCLSLYKESGDNTYLERAYTFNNRNKAIVLRETQQQQAAITYGNLPLNVQDREQDLKEELATLTEQVFIAKNTSEKDSINGLLATAQYRYQAFTAELEQEYPRYFQLKYAAQDELKLADIQQQLGPKQAVVEYFAGQEKWYSFLLTKEHFEVFAWEKNQTVEDDIYSYHELLTNGIAEDCEALFAEISHRLYQHLLAEPLSSIDRQNINRLIFIPDGLLHFVSFESLLSRPVQQLADTDAFVLMQFACSYHYSPYFLVHPMTPNKATNTHTFGGFGMEYDDYTLEYLAEVFALEKTEAIGDNAPPCDQIDTTRKLGKLYYSDDEVLAIANIMEGDYWLDGDVTKEQFIHIADKYNILHLALHGSYDLDYPMNSALAFTKTEEEDPLLHAYDIYNLELDCAMVALSACNTSFGKLIPGEGAMTLARAFNYAGAPSVLASLWSLPDRSASIIMPRFYEALQAGDPKDVALQKAKLAYLQDDALSTPSTRLPTYWGPTIIIGDTSSIVATAAWWKHPFSLLLLVVGLLVFFTIRQRKEK